MSSARWFRLAIGLLLLIGPMWVLFSRLDPIWNGHPAYPATLLVVAAAGLVLIASTAPGWRHPPDEIHPAGAAVQDPDVIDPVTHRATGRTSGDAMSGGTASSRATDGADPDGNASPGKRPSQRGTSGWRVTGRVLIAVLAAAVVGGLVWLRPFPAGDTALAALQSDATVTVIDHPTTIEFIPAQLSEPQVGLVFSPGARVDARAYAALLRPAAEAGYLVVILKEPFGLAITQIGQSAGPIADHPEVERWAVGGHSLGGVSAAWFAADHLDVVNGLLLWASFPNDDMSGDTSLQVESIYGSNDLLATPADIERSKSKLPPDTTFTEIEGGVHAFFGDYGEQPGDGVPAISREQASAEISAATVDFLARLAKVPAG